MAEVLGECGATVYVTARSTRQRPSRNPAWTVEDTAELVRQAGGRGVPVAVDHIHGDQVASLFARISDEHGPLGLLVNNVWQWGPPETYLAPTREQPVERWDAMFGVALRSHFLATKHALPVMLAQRRGLIVFTQERPGDHQHFGQNLVVDVAAVATQRMVQYLAAELAESGVAALLVYLGWVRSVNMGMGFDPAAVGMSQDDVERMTQSPHLAGRAIAALAGDPDVAFLSGSTLYSGDIARRYGFTDTDGRIPRYEGS